MQWKLWRGGGEECALACMGDHPYFYSQKTAQRCIYRSCKAMLNAEVFMSSEATVLPKINK